MSTPIKPAANVRERTTTALAELLVPCRSAEEVMAVLGVDPNSGEAIIVNVMFTAAQEWIRLAILATARAVE